ncbi:MAG: head-tail connector protein [Cucumibacter sp.]
MTSILLAGPATEPISLADAKAYLRVDSGDEDNLISTLIAAGRVHLEAITRRAMIDQNWRVILDAWPQGDEVSLPLGPFRALLAVRIFDEAGAATELPLAQFLPETGSAPGRIVLPGTVAGTPLARERLAVEIDFTAGYGEDPGDVPAGLKQALMSLVAHWFEHREAVLMAGSGAIVPASFDQLIAPYRVIAL